MKFIKDKYMLFRLIPLFLTLCCFINTLGFEFVTDDFYQIVKPARILGDWSFANLKDLFVSDFWSFMTKGLGPEERHGSAYYRPVSSLFFMVSYVFADLTPWKWHLISILLQLSAVVLVYQMLLSSLQKLNLREEDHKYWLVLIASSIFAIHPIQSESVAWGGASTSSLIVTLNSLALLAYLKTREYSLKSKEFVIWLLTSSFFYTLAILTKENSLCLALILFCYEALLLDQTLGLSTRLKRAFISSIPFVLVTILYFIIRILVFGVIVPKLGLIDNPEFAAGVRPTSIFTLPIILLTYLKNFIFPFFLAPLYPVKYVYDVNLWNFYLPALILVAVILLLAFISWNNLVSRLAVVWLTIPLFPSLNLSAFGPEGLVQDRYFNFSLIGGGILLGQVLLLLNKRLSKESGKKDTIETKSGMRFSTLTIAAVVLFLLALTTIKQNYIWQNEWEHFSASQRSYPESCYANLELARLNIEKGFYSQAINHYETAKITCPNSRNLYKHLGVLYGQIGDLTKAENEFRQLLKLSQSPLDKSEAYFNLGLVCEKKGNKLQAIEFYQQSLTFNPKEERASQALKDLQ